MTTGRPVRVFGDGAVVLDTSTVDEAHGVAASIVALGRPGIEDVIVGYRSVTVVADPTTVDVADLADELASMPSGPPDRGRGRRAEIPVTFDGADLDDVADLSGLAPEQVVDLLTGTDLPVAFVGFAPGFAYLVGLPPALASVPRRPTPRPTVPGGSVALAGGFAGVYPQSSPGGWHLVGRTGMRLFDPDASPYSALAAGDRVRFLPSEVHGPPPVPTDAGRRPLRSRADRTVAVEDGGLLSFVQDGGRVGVAALGVPRAGVADPYAARTANRLVGNDEGAAVIEATAGGPTLRFSAATFVAVVGTTQVTVDGHRVPDTTVVPVSPGQALTVGAAAPGLRLYIAVDGGFDMATVLGSRSTDVLSRLGPGALRGGDVVGLGPPVRPRGGRGGGGGPGADARSGTVLRVLIGPDEFPSITVERLFSTSWEVDPASDRIGVRLGGGPPLDDPGPAVPSRGMVTGAVQLPPDGRPIILLCDHATVGGYPVVATVVSADVGVVGQLGPGDRVRFAPVDLVQAARARAVRERAVRDAAVGWYPVRTD